MDQTFDAAAARLLAEQETRLPDLSAVTVIVPHHHVAPPFLAALRRQLREPVFMPPRLATLPDLAAAQGAVAGVQTDSQRLSALHDFLSRQNWLPAMALWPMAGEVLDLLHEMDDAKLAPPASFGDYAAQVERACRRGLSAPLEREARLIYALWRAFHEAAPGRRRAYASNLAAWMERVSGPVYSLGLTGLCELERQFVDRCRERVGLVELPVAEPRPERRQWLDAALRPPSGAPGLRERALAWSTRSRDCPLDVDLLPAPDLESEARAVAARIRGWLTEGRQEIAVIALDRMSARRLRAVLERHGVLVRDETGWMLSTATVSHVLDRWLALLQDGFYHRDLLDLLKSPFVFADLAAGARLEAVSALERAAARDNVAAGLERFLALAVGDAAGARAMLERLAEAAAPFRGTRRRTLAGWLEALFQALDRMGATAAFASDQAGRQLLELLHRLAGELAGGTARHDLAGWRAWLGLQLDRATFEGDRVDSPVRLTHLAAARLRDFDAVVLLGADAAHLPGAGRSSLLGEAVKVQLGLRGQVQRHAETLEDFIGVMCRAGRVLIAWRSRNGVDPNPRSPWLDALSAFSRIAHGDDLVRALPLDMPWPVPAVGSSRPAPAVARLPGRISASAWQALVDCPYRFFARHLLQLGEEEAVAEVMEKRDYGERVHEVLRRFHGRHPILADAGREELQDSLLAIGAEVFGASRRNDYLALAWEQRWQRHAPDYLDWALGREAEGWRWQDAEAVFERDLPLAGDRSIRLYGRIDRLDRGPAGLAVLDYKTQSRQVLRGRLKTAGESVQLPFYGLLTGADQAGLVALDDDKVGLVEMPVPLDEAVAGEARRLAETLAAVAAGAAMPAHGAPETCGVCEMRGLCRRD